MITCFHSIGKCKSVGKVLFSAHIIQNWFRQESWKDTKFGRNPWAYLHGIGSISLFNDFLVTRGKSLKPWT